MGLEGSWNSSGLLIRPAEPPDALAVAGVHVRAWRAAYRGLMPEAYLNGMRPEDRAVKYHFAATDPQKPQTLLAIELRTIVGFVTTAPTRDAELGDLGEVCALYVDPVFWGRGFGAALISAACTRLVEQGYRRACLWVLEGNERADRFYRKGGWLPDGHRRTDTVWDIKVNELRYRRDL